MSEAMIATVQSCAKLGQVKCERCFHWSYSMNFDGLCNRCVAILCKHFPEHEAAAKCVENLALRGLKPEDNPEWENV